MNNNVVEKTLKSIDNIDRLSDLAAISIYNTSHEAIDKFDVMQEHATPEYVEGEFVQESLLTGVLIGAGIIGVAISAFLIIKKIIESKAKGDPNAAPNTVAGVNLLNPDEINKLFDGWNDKYFKNHPDLVAEDVPGADVSELNTYNGLLLESIRKFCDDATKMIDGLNELSDADMKVAIDDLNKEFDSNINMNELVSKTGRVDKNTILQIKAAAEDISKTLREFDMQVTKCIEGFRNKEKNNQNSDSDTEGNKISEENIKLLEKALKAKANTAGTIMVNFRNKCLEGIAQALDAKVKELAGEAKQQQQDNTGLTPEQKQLILKKVQARVPEADEHNISDEIARFGVAKSEQELKSLLDAEFEAMESNPNTGSKDSFKRMATVASEIAQIKGFNWNESVSALYNLNALVPGEDDESSAETETPEGTPKAEPAATGESEEKSDDFDQTQYIDKNRAEEAAARESTEEFGDDSSDDSAKQSTPEQPENAEKKEETETKQSSVDSTKNVLNDDALLTAYADKRFGGNKEQARQHAEYLQKLDAKTFKNNIMKQVFVNVLIDHKQSGLNEAIDDIYNNYMSDFKDANISPDESMNDINAIHLSEDEINKLRQIFSRLSIGKNFSDKHFCQRLADMIKDNSGNEFDAAMNRLESGFPPFNDIKDFKTEIEQNMRVFNKQFSDNPEENDLNNIQFTITNMSMEGLFNWAKQKYDTPYAVNRYELACKLARNALHLNDKFVPKPKELNGETPETPETKNAEKNDETPENQTGEDNIREIVQRLADQYRFSADNSVDIMMDQLSKHNNDVNVLRNLQVDDKVRDRFNKFVDAVAKELGQDVNSEYPDDAMFLDPENKKGLIKDLADYMKAFPDQSDDDAFQVRGFNTLRISPELAKELKTSARELANKGTSEDASNETGETSNTKLFTDEEVDKIVDAVYAVKGLDRKFRQEIYNAVTDDGFAEAANKLYAKYADDANKLNQIHTTLIAMAKSIDKESEVPALPTTEATPTESETSAENQTPEQTENAEKKEETPSTEETTGTPETPKEEEQSETSGEESNGNDIKKISDSTGLDEVKVENIYKILKDNSTPDDIKRAFIIDTIGPMIHMPGFNQKMANDGFKINYDNFKKVAEAASIPFEIERPEISEKDINDMHTIISSADTEETKIAKIADNLMNSTSEPEDEILNTADTIENANQDQNKPPTQVTSDDLIAAKNANIDEEIAERIAYAINNNKDITSGVVVPAMGTADINERPLNLFEQSQYLKTYDALVKAFNYFHLDPNQYLDPEKYPDPKSLGILSDEERAEQEQKNKWWVDLADKLFDYLSDNKTIAEFISDKKISEQDVADALNHIGMGDISVPIDENKVRRDMGISELKTQAAPKAQPSSPSNSSAGSRAGSNQRPAAPKQGSGQPAGKPVNKPKSGAKQQPANKPGIFERFGKFLGF